jgi:hypothetical protein
VRYEHSRLEKIIKKAQAVTRNAPTTIEAREGIIKKAIDKDHVDVINVTDNQTRDRISSPWRHLKLWGLDPRVDGGETAIASPCRAISWRCLASTTSSASGDHQSFGDNPSPERFDLDSMQRFRSGWMCDEGTER